MEKAIEIIILTAWQELEKIDFLQLFTNYHNIKYEAKDTAFKMCAISLAMIWNNQYWILRVKKIAKSFCIFFTSFY